MITTSTVFKVVLLVCIVLLVGLIVKLEMAIGGGMSSRGTHAGTIEASNNL